MYKMLERGIDPTGALARSEKQESDWDAGERFLEANADDAVRYARSEVMMKELIVERGYPLWIETEDGEMVKITTDNMKELLR